MPLTAWTDGVRVRFLLNPADENLAGWGQMALAEGLDPLKIPAWQIVAGALQPDLTAAWADMRAVRAARLAACDWTQLPDVSEPVRLRWQAYRQALRDLPDTTTDPCAPDWPLPPA